MGEPVIIEVVHTPFARYGGVFERAGIEPENVEGVVNGAVTRTGEQGADVGRLGVMLAGLEATGGQLGPPPVMHIGHGTSTVLERL